MIEMEKLESKKVAEALNITEQQLEILACLYKLESMGRRVNPKSIMNEYRDIHGKPIQSSNFFSQTKQLQDKNLIRKVGAARYALNLEQIKRILAEKREQRLAELREFEKLTDDAGEYFKSMIRTAERPLVEYFEYEELFASLTKKVKTAKKIYLVNNFPTIAYTYKVANGIGRGEFLKALWDRAFEKEKLKLYCLTTLQVDYPFNHAFRVLGDPEKAYSECKIMVDQLQSQIESHENLKIRFHEDTPSLDVMIIDDGEFYLFTRDEHRNIQGGIHIQSPGTTASTKAGFMKEFEYALEVDKDVVKKLMKNLDEKYGPANYFPYKLYKETGENNNQGDKITFQ
jgi:hypothetical protein